MSLYATKGAAMKPVEPIYQAVGARMAMIRDVLGLTQEEVASRIGLSRAALANIEIGRARTLPHIFERIAKALGTTPKHLMKGIWW